MSVPGRLQQKFARNLRRIRLERGYSQEAFAHEVLGVHRTYVGMLERGERSVTLNSLEDYAQRIGVEPMELLAELVDEGP